MLYDTNLISHKPGKFSHIASLKRPLQAPKGKTYIRQAILDVSMANGHDGLSRIAKKSAGIDVGTLLPGELILFVNSKQDKIKLLGSSNSMIYVKTRGRVPVALLKNLPEILGGRETLNYDEVMAPYLIREVNRN